MALVNVYTGSNGSLILSNEDTPEGQDAKAVFDAYDLVTVGRVTDVELFVNTRLEEFHEVGRRLPVSLHSQEIRIRGKVGRAYCNGALLSLLLGRGSLSASVAEPYPQPALNMAVHLDDPALPGNHAWLGILGVKFENWAYTLPQDDFVMENLTFKALTIGVLDAEGAPGGGEGVPKVPVFPPLAGA